MQDPADFKRCVSSPRNSVARKRLQELALQIPPGYGSGADFDEARQEVVDAALRHKRAQNKAKKAGAAYAQHIRLIHEERSLLSNLGLSANLFRKDSQ